MARITITDCLDAVGNKFILVRGAAQRAYQLTQGARPFIENKDNNAEIVLALREIASGKVKILKELKEKSPFEPELF